MDHFSGATERKKRHGHKLTTDALTYKLGQTIGKRSMK